MSKLEISVTRRPPTGAVVTLRGHIDGRTVEDLERAIERERAAGVAHLVLDMADVRYVNSTGLGLLVKHASALREVGGGFALARVAPRVRIVIDMLGLQPFLAVHLDPDGALAALTEPPTPEPAGPPPGPDTSEAMRAEAGLEPGPFPRNVACRCRTELEVPRAGRWRCPRCFAVFEAAADGRVRPTPAPGLPPIELVLDASPGCGEGLVHLVTSVCREVMPPEDLALLRRAVHEVCTALTRVVYAEDAAGVYHVSLERAPRRVQIRIADSGATLPSGGFVHAPRLSEFEHRPHPTGVGNTFRLVQAASG